MLNLLSDPVPAPAPVSRNKLFRCGYCCKLNRRTTTWLLIRFPVVTSTDYYID